MTAAVGQPISRVDGRQKVTGTARYAAEFDYPNLAHAALVTSTVSKGKVTSLDTAAAEAAPGVVLVMTHRNAPKMRTTDQFGTSMVKPAAGSSTVQVLNTDRVHWYGQPVAVVVAETWEQARFAASLVRVEYAAEPAHIDIGGGGRVFVPLHVQGEKPEVKHGDAEAALAKAAVRVDHEYTTPQHNHNAMEPHATVAAWAGDAVTVHDATQFVFGVRHEIAQRFGLNEDAVRVVAPLVGGGFGGKGICWPHTYLAVAAAKVAGRPVKLSLPRAQVYATVGGRTPTRQRVALGADRDGTLVSLIHTGRTTTSTSNTFTEQFTFPARHLYASRTMHVRQELIELDVCPPTFMRAPGETPGTFALESAMDELAVALDLDPVELRRRNDPDKDPATGKPFSNRRFKEALALGAEKFGWSRRTPAPRSMTDGRLLVGMGMATAFYPVYQMRSAARVEVTADGTACVQSGCHEMGMGTATAQAQVAADLLGLPLGKVTFELGDTAFPFSMVAGGSSQTISVAAAVKAACANLKEKLLKLAGDASPLSGAKDADVVFRDGGLARADDPGVSESFAAILRRAGLRSLDVAAEVVPGAEKHAMFSYGAQFVEVRVDPDFGTVRVAKAVAAFDVGLVINPKTARSQFLGGITMGLGMALLEETHRDGRTGQLVNADLAEYMVPVNADVPSIEPHWVGDPDPHTPLGAHGIGEIGITGVAAAVANAVYHATGKRVRELPVTPERLMD